MLVKGKETKAFMQYTTDVLCNIFPEFSIITKKHKRKSALLCGCIALNNLIYNLVFSNHL